MITLATFIYLTQIHPKHCTQKQLHEADRSVFVNQIGWIQRREGHTVMSYLNANSVIFMHDDCNM